MAKNYIGYISPEHKQAEKNIDEATREMRKHLNFLRKDLVGKNRLKQEEMDMYLNSLLSNQKCKNEITEEYQMKDLDKKDNILWNSYLETYKEKSPQLLSRPCYRIDDKKNNPEEMKKIENIRKRFLEQKKENSYKRDPKTKKPKQFEEKYTNIVKTFDTRDVVLNQILEFAVRNIFEEILKDMKGKKNIQDIKVIKTNEYDDVLSKTDFILEIHYKNNQKSYEAIDLTTSNDSSAIEEKQYPKETGCRNFRSIEKELNEKIPRTVIVINDKEFLCKYLRGYMQKIKEKGKINSQEVVEIRNNLGEKSIKIKEDILQALTKNISLN